MRTRTAGGQADGASATRRVNPAFIPRNGRVEQASDAAVQDYFEPFERLVRVRVRVQQTFCGI